MTDLNALYAAAVDSHGQARADAAAAASIEAYNTNAVGGLSQEACEAEQAAAFVAAMDADGQ